MVWCKMQVQSMFLFKLIWPHRFEIIFSTTSDSIRSVQKWFYFLCYVLFRNFMNFTFYPRTNKDDFDYYGLLLIEIKNIFISTIHDVLYLMSLVLDQGDYEGYFISSKNFD